MKLQFTHPNVHFCNYSLPRCAICQTVVRKPAQLPETVGFVYGHGDTYVGTSAPVILQNGRLDSPIPTNNHPHGINLIREDGGRADLDNDVLEAFCFHHDCYRLLRTFINSASATSLGLFIWLFAHSAQQCWTIWPTEDVGRTMLQVKQVFLDREVLLTQHSMSKRSESEADELLARLVDLPEEILENISCQMQPCAWIRFATTLKVSKLHGKLRRPVETHCTIDLSQDLWVAHAHLAGRRYLTGLDNSPFPGSHRIAELGGCNRFVVTLDEIGVIDISSAIPSVNRVATQVDQVPKWFKVIDCMGLKRPHYVEVKWKGGLVCDLQNVANYTDIIWDLPVHRTTDLRFDICESGWQTIRRLPPLMVHSATLSQTTSGISVVSYPMDSGVSFTMIDTQSGNKSSRLNKARGLEFLSPSKRPGLLYEHFPLAKDELIIQVWVRCRRTQGPRGERFTIAICTNHDRRKTFGPWIEEGNRHQYYHIPLVKPHDGPVHTIFYGTQWLGSIGWPWNQAAVHFGVECLPQPSNHKFTDRFQWPTSPIGSPLSEFDQEDFFGFADYHWHFSEAKLEDVTRIEQCVHPNREDEATAGLMLHYGNRKEVLGQWNFDWPTIAHNLAPTHLALRRYQYSNMRIPSVKIEPRIRDGSQVVGGMPSISKRWFEEDELVVPMVGRLIWFYSQYGDSIAYFRPNGSAVVSGFMGLPL